MGLPTQSSVGSAAAVRRKQLAFMRLLSQVGAYGVPIAGSSNYPSKLSSRHAVRAPDFEPRSFTPQDSTDEQGPREDADDRAFYRDPAAYLCGGQHHHLPDLLPQGRAEAQLSSLGCG